ncbi:MAG: hypothetical protein ABI443_10710, partial [Chthoniobacterales bacterium]
MRRESVASSRRRRQLPELPLHLIRLRQRKLVVFLPIIHHVQHTVRAFKFRGEIEIKSRIQRIRMGDREEGESNQA